ncbi:MAG: hypothetical protein BIFFINMI_02681 [Phycisphaerae bacterium]|nr:hypothetical protein [Phycisphaerae bacterium]
MTSADTGQRDLLLIGGNGAAVAEIAGHNGWSIRRAPTGFDALAMLMDGPAPDAVLVDAQSQHPRVGALLRSLRSAREGLTLFLLSPAHLEPEARRAVAQAQADDYLITPMDDADWRRLAADVEPAPTPAARPRAAPATVPASPASETRVRRDVPMGDLDRLLAAMDQPLDAFLSAAARWASESLGGATVRVRWSARTARHPMGMPEPQGQLIPLAATLGGESGEIVIGDEGEVPPGAAEEVASVLQRMLGQRQRMAMFRQMAFTDYLSGARNRRFLVHSLQRLIPRAQREGWQLTLLVFDIDNFKHYNDQYGHVAGDGIIRDIVALMRQCTRPQDIVARIGGDEFAVLLWDSGPPRQLGSRHPEAVEAVIKRFRRVLAGHSFKSLGPEARGTLTISGGLATFPADGSDADALMARATGGLKSAKQSGKDRIWILGRDPAGASPI